MKNILITGAMGQIGTELVEYLGGQYGQNRIVATDIRPPQSNELHGSPFQVLDARNGEQLLSLCKKYDIGQIIHLAALLSGVAENQPQKAYDINMNGLYNVLEVARENDIKVFTPSSIAVFGPTTPKDCTPQDTIQQPTSMYGVTKVAGELLCNYYHNRFGVDTRGVRFPGLISYKTLPGGGTTDYAVHIYYEALNKKAYTSFIGQGTKMDMMYIPDALTAIHQLIEADPSKLIHRNAFNITAMSFAPEDIAAEIQKHIPGFKLSYEVDPMRQRIADSWPNSLDDSCAREEWGWNPKYDLASMTKDMLEKLNIKLNSLSA